MTTKEMIKIMEAFENGAEIECNYKNNDKWFKVYTPIWDWDNHNYRVKQPPKKKLWYWEYCANGIWYFYSIRMTESQAKVKFKKTCGYKKLEAFGYIEED